MDLRRYVESEEFTELAQAGQIRSARIILRVICRFRDELREQNERNPQERPDDLTKDWRFRQGAIWMTNRILSIVQGAQDTIQAADNIGSRTG